MPFNLVNQDQLVDAHCQCGHNPPCPFCSVVTILDLVREKEQTCSKGTASGSESHSFSGLSSVRDSDGSPAVAVIPTCGIANLGLTLRLDWP